MKTKEQKARNKALSAFLFTELFISPFDKPIEMIFIYTRLSLKSAGYRIVPPQYQVSVVVDK